MTNLIQEEMNKEQNNELTLDNEAVITVDVDRKALVVYFGGDRNAVLAFKTDKELELCGTVLADPKFWDNFLQAFSGALQINVR